MKTLGEHIRELRERNDLSLREFAKRLNLSAPFVSDIELGRRSPSEKVLEKIAETLGVSPEELRSYDTRVPISELKKLVKSNPAYGIALRKLVDKKISPEEIIRMAGMGAVPMEAGTALRGVRDAHSGFTNASRPPWGVDRRPESRPAAAREKPSERGQVRLWDDGRGR